MESKFPLRHSTPTILWHHPSGFLYVYCFQDLRFSLLKKSGLKPSFLLLHQYLHFEGQRNNVHTHTKWLSNGKFQAPTYRKRGDMDQKSLKYLWFYKVSAEGGRKYNTCGPAAMETSSFKKTLTSRKYLLMILSN